MMGEGERSGQIGGVAGVPCEQESSSSEDWYPVPSGMAASRGRWRVWRVPGTPDTSAAHVTSTTRISSSILSPFSSTTLHHSSYTGALRSQSVCHIVTSVQLGTHVTSYVHVTSAQVGARIFPTFKFQPFGSTFTHCSLTLTP
jgi:hypothetical protein